MKPLLFVVLIILVVTSHCGADSVSDMVEPLLESVTSTIEGLVQKIEDLQKTVFHLGRQTMLQQFAMEENLRTQFDSGVRVMHGGARGLKTYEQSSNIGESVNAIHDHANFMSTLGMGEVTVTMNGVYFKTRHNDYKMVMASTTSTEYGATESVPFPGVPPEVTGSVEEQIIEMREWFRAFHTQNTTLRDYPKYFKPILCYLEGVWTTSEELEELFSSERHHLEGKSWADLQQKLRFSGYSGVLNSRENWAYLPTAIMDMNYTTGEPVYAQWNYRLLCHPIKRDIPLSKLVPIDDLRFRMANRRTKEQILKSRGARFKLYDDTLSETYNLLDEIFYTTPGMDNRPADCQQETFDDGPMYDVRPEYPNQLLNTCFYHRYYKFYKNGAMGLSRYPRGFNDGNLWVAQNHQEKVAPMGINQCSKAQVRGKGGNRPVKCSMRYNRFSYAIPMEIVFLTPLLSWNPYNFTIHQKRGKASGNGKNGVDLPFSGVDSAHYYLTPMEFYKMKKRDIKDSAADTSGATAKVKDQEGIVRRARAAGPHIFLRNIPPLGRVRLRYPISPMDAEGSTVWKELDALKDWIIENKHETEPSSVLFEMSPTVREPPGEHTHEFTLSYKQFLDMRQNGAKINVTTDDAQSHTHDLQIIYSAKQQMYKYTKCDKSPKCWDRHDYPLILISKNEFTDL